MLSLKSPAKVNLFLRVLARRADGYHELASLFQCLDLCDTLHFTFGDEDGLTCDDEGVPTDGTNLILKAADLFRRKTGLDFGLHVHLEKNIPVRSGLGGGSSNAATTLWALNHLKGKPATPQQLGEWGAELGADVPFFFSCGRAYCTGLGTTLTPLPPISSEPFWLVKPDQGLPTPLIYQRLRVEELEPYDPQELLETHLKGVPQYRNDLEEPAFALYPKLASLKKRLLEGGYTAVTMTGSGSALCCMGRDEAPSIPDLWSCRVSYLCRPEAEWYSPTAH